MRLAFFQRRSASWALAAAWTGLIFATIPVARTLQRFIEPRAGAHIYLVAAIFVGSLGVLATLVRMIRTPPRRIPRRLAWLAVLGVFSLWVLHRQLQTAAEAIHFVEYGILGFLVFRAWRHDVRDPLIYPVCALSLALVAWLDEFLQWLTAERFWDFRDIRLNLLAGFILFAFIAVVIVPAGIRGPVARASVRRLCYLSWALLLALGLSISATPRRVDALAVRIPFLRFLYNNESVMIEYGHRHAVPGIGAFKSRLTLQELQRADAGRGLEAGARLAQQPPPADHREFRKAFAASADPFVHEMGMHLLLRDHYYDVCWQYRTADPARFVNHVTVAVRENRILETFFPRSLEGAGQHWTPEQHARCAVHADFDLPYLSEVAEHLVTAVKEWELWLLLLALAGGVGWLHARHGRGRPGG